MERHSKHYNKGKAGHPMNMNVYRMFRIKAKKWRYPLALIVTFVLVWTLPSQAGENLETSVLNSLREKVSDNAITIKDTEAAKKELLLFVDEIIDDCKRLDLSPCTEKGKKLVSGIQQATDARELLPYLSSVENFEGEFSRTRELASCWVDLGKLIPEGEAWLEKLNNLSLSDADYANGVSAVEEGLNELRDFVSSCRKSLKEEDK